MLYEHYIQTLQKHKEVDTRTFKIILQHTYTSELCRPWVPMVLEDFMKKRNIF